uniref:Uncharacterized protein n=1 Tax=Opuntia streptacantha TaxID=393608 RepID=A0A7C9DWS4_OPUST
MAKNSLKPLYCLLEHIVTIQQLLQPLPLKTMKSCSMAYILQFPWLLFLRILLGHSEYSAKGFSDAEVIMVSFALSISLTLCALVGYCLLILCFELRQQRFFLELIVNVFSCFVV